MLEEEKWRKKELEFSAFFCSYGEFKKKNCTHFGHHSKQCGHLQGHFEMFCKSCYLLYYMYVYVLLRWVEVEIAEQLSHVFLVKKGLLVLLLGAVSISASFQEVLKCKHLHQSYFSHTLTVVKMSIRAVIVLHSGAKKNSNSAIFLSEAENFKSRNI